MRYRKEVDGLRSVAVLPVIFFHAGLEVFSGGYLGVDIFFVISGFLITSTILNDLALGKFSLSRFYERRARRILPALSLVVLTSLPMAWFFMLPDPLENFGQSAVATMFSLNNVLLTMTSGYWDLASEFKPLLHTWSLAVEEQFYIVFPIMLMGVYPILKRHTITMIWVIVIASFIAAILLVEDYPTSTFYLLHTRAWELGIGALGAFWENKRSVTANERLSLLGLGAVLIPFFLFNEQTPHPSYPTLVPVLGALLILLFAKEGTLVARVLSLKLMVGLGLISYSLYLWHQPLFAFVRILSFEEPSTALLLGLSMLALPMSYLSWRFVEQPFRHHTTVSAPRLVAACTAATVGLSALGLSLHFGKGFPGRIFSTNAEIAAGSHIGYNHRISSYNVDGFIKEEGERILIIGNSQARDFANILIEMGVTDSTQLIYRPELSLCIPESRSASETRLIAQSDIIFYPIVSFSKQCMAHLATGKVDEENIIFVGPKHFGYNLNAFVRLPDEGRPNYTNRVFNYILESNAQNAAAIPAERYIDLIDHATIDGSRIHIFDTSGDIISADRVHITQAGAVFFANLIVEHPALNFFHLAQETRIGD